MLNLTDFIWVEHKAGGRSPQRVKKFRSTCTICNKDRGYVFKANYKESCSSCSIKTQYLNGREVNTNENGFKCTVEYRGKEINLRSSYELFFYNYLRKNKIHFEYEPETFELYNRATYRPDFYLVNENKYVEIKGLLRERDATNIKDFKEKYPDKHLEVLTKPNLIEMGFNEKDYFKFHSLRINGSLWRAEFLDFKEFTKRCGDDCTAMTDFEKKRIYLHLRSATLQCIRHEIFHAYISTYNMAALDLDDEQVEELACEVFGNHGKLAIQQADQVYRDFKTLRKHLCSY